MIEGTVSLKCSRCNHCEVCQWVDLKMNGCDWFEEEPRTWRNGRMIINFPSEEEFAKDVAEKALDEIEINGHTIRQWIHIIAEQDCIIRQAAIDLADELKDDLPDDDHLSDMVMSHNEGILEYQTKLSLLPPVTPAEKVGRWIPVSERLPEDLEPVNITWANHNPESYYADIKDKPFTATGHYCKGRWYWYSNTCQDYLEEYGRCDVDEIDTDIEVIAWMPLPEPYKAESEGAE